VPHSRSLESDSVDAGSTTVLRSTEGENTDLDVKHILLDIPVFDGKAHDCLEAIRGTFARPIFTKSISSYSTRGARRGERRGDIQLSTHIVINVSVSFRHSCSVSRLDLDMWTLTAFSGLILFTSRSSASKTQSTPTNFYTCRAKIIAVLLRTQNSAKCIWE